MFLIFIPAIICLFVSSRSKRINSIDHHALLRRKQLLGWKHEVKELLTCREDIIGDNLIDVRRIITGRFPLQSWNPPSGDHCHNTRPLGRHSTDAPTPNTFTKRAAWQEHTTMETLHHCGGSSDWQISGGGSSPGHSLEHPPWFPRTHSEERSLWIPPANSPSHPGHWGSAHHRISTKTLRNRGKRFLNSIGNARFCTSEANSIWL